MWACRSSPLTHFNISGTPHTYHYTGTVLALNAGKHVLCEKPFTSNAAELRALITLAKEKNLFLMEAMWTRFQPIALAVSKLIQEKALGEIRVLCVACFTSWDTLFSIRYQTCGSSWGL